MYWTAVVQNLCSVCCVERNFVWSLANKYHTNVLVNIHIPFSGKSSM